MHRQRMSTTRLRPPSNLSRSPHLSAQLFTLVQTHGRAPETSIHARHARTGQVGQQSVRKTSNLTFGPLRRIHRRILSTRRFGFSAAVLGTMFLGGDLWFESFAVPWLAEGPFPQVLSSDPSILFALGAISSYLLFAIGGVSFGVASLRARVFPVWISSSS
jgi:hypothetical protein